MASTSLSGSRHRRTSSPFRTRIAMSVSLIAADASAVQNAALAGLLEDEKLPRVPPVRQDHGIRVRDLDEILDRVAIGPRDERRSDGEHHVRLERGLVQRVQDRRLGAACARHAMTDVRKDIGDTRLQVCIAGERVQLATKDARLHTSDRLALHVTQKLVTIALARRRLPDDAHAAEVRPVPVVHDAKVTEHEIAWLQLRVARTITYRAGVRPGAKRKV